MERGKKYSLTTIDRLVLNGAITHFQLEFMLKMLLAFLFTISSAQARLVQIIHTNDLHSYFAGTRGGESETSQGGEGDEVEGVYD